MEKRYYLLLKQRIEQHELDFLIRHFHEKLGLNFVSSVSAYEDLCFINSDEVRIEYKSYFGIEDLGKFLIAQGIEIDNFDVFKIHLPESSFDFWIEVEKCQ